MHTDGDNINKHSASPHQEPRVDSEHPGYEVEDVNVKGISVFLVGLFGVVIIFFVFCYVAGRMINNWDEADYAKLYGAPDKWHGGPVAKGEREDLKSNYAIEQQQLGQITAAFPQPQLDIDDGNQATAELHAREDLLLNNYSLVDGQPGAIRIPIDRAMELIAQRGLPVATQPAAATTSVAHADKPELRQPLTTGFARTGYELTTIAAREQKMDYGNAEANAHAELTPQK